jgi:hypothetical protein
MVTEPFENAVGNVFLIVLLAFLGLMCIYSVVGVPVGLALIGMAIAVAVMRVHGES